MIAATFNYENTLPTFALFVGTFTNLRNAITNSSDFFACEFTFPRPIVLVPKNADKIVLRVSDDLTPIELFQVFATGYQEFE